MNALVERWGAAARWAAWRLIDGRKLPVGANGRAASISNPATWLTLDEARALVRGVPPERGGVMLALSAEMRLLCVDFDSSVERNRITNPAAREFVQAAQSYAEVSPSRRGLHVWLELAETWRPARCRLSAGEAYTDRRFMTCTGWSIEADGEYFAIWGDRPRAIRTVSVEEARRLLALLGYSEPAPVRPAMRPAQVHAMRPAMRPAQVHAMRPARLTRAQAAGLIAHIARQREGNRNSALYWAAHRLRDAGATCDVALAALLPAATAAGLTEREAARTIQSAFGGAA